MRAALTVACSIWLLLITIAEARSRRSRASSAGDFSYYLLVLSYAPDFCDQPQGNKDPRECGAGRQLGFVVHGLWPQGDTSRGPEFCGGSSPVSQAIVQSMLRYIPTESLIQHEWTAHGTCSGLGAGDYFAILRKARDFVKLPPDLDQSARRQQFSPSQIESKFAAANPALPRAAFHTSCYRDGELEEIRICFNKDLSPRACGPSAGECSASTVTVLPVR